MNLRHLRIFLTVCETGTMTRAAQSLYMTQPSVSQVIAELEKVYSVRLFERLNRRLYLTMAGERLRSYASHLINLSDQAKKELADLGAGGSIRIGASLTIGAHLLPRRINAYRQAMPEVEIFTLVDNTAVIEKLLLADQLDLGLVEGPVYSPHLREDILSDDDLIIIWRRSTSRSWPGKRSSSASPAVGPATSSNASCRAPKRVGRSPASIRPSSRRYGAISVWRWSPKYQSRKRQNAAWSGRSRSRG
jgi:DNA-binding transcriptional LysR family regulator